MPSRSSRRRRVDMRALESKRRDKQRASWAQMKAAAAAKYQIRRQSNG